MPLEIQSRARSREAQQARKSATASGFQPQFPYVCCCAILAALPAREESPVSHLVPADTTQPSPSVAESWSIFCSVIDNFGDMGVCWRLARQLAHEHGVDVTLWIDDLDAFARFMRRNVWVAEDVQAEDVQGVQQEFGVCVRRWCSPWQESEQTNAAIAHSAVVIEAFACELPVPVITAMARQAQPPAWINLEYLSAEPWVAGCHRLQSMHSVPVEDVHQESSVSAIVTLNKTFFFPGFEEGTGGLLREKDLLGKHAAWQRDESATRLQLMAALGLPRICGAITLWISVFTYESPAFASWLTALGEGGQPALCLVPEGRALNSITAFLNLDEPPVVGEPVQHGALTIAVTPFLSQDDYDCLLSLCDLNLVRGEDSFVRAQWAGKPLIWHIYPQQDDVHMEKLDAFLALYFADDADECSENGRADLDAWRQFCRFWNLGEDCRELWHHLRPQLPGLRQHAGEWRQKLVQLPDLAENLVQFYDTAHCLGKRRSAPSSEYQATVCNINIGPSPSNSE